MPTSQEQSIHTYYEKAVHGKTRKYNSSIYQVNSANGNSSDARESGFEWKKRAN